MVSTSTSPIKNVLSQTGYPSLSSSNATNTPG